MRGCVTLLLLIALYLKFHLQPLYPNGISYLCLINKCGFGILWGLNVCVCGGETQGEDGTSQLQLSPPVDGLPHRSGHLVKVSCNCAVFYSLALGLLDWQELQNSPGAKKELFKQNYGLFRKTRPQIQAYRQKHKLYGLLVLNPKLSHTLLNPLKVQSGVNLIRTAPYIQ